ncbi:hypothetical protein [Klebsiella pneumoniae]|uniref:hypothetical protein n=1 Tax=Klebsiella pneumoniae TaxID=573 RepID=UPI0038FCBD78
MVIFRIIRKLIVYGTGRKEGTKLYDGYVQLNGQEANDYISKIIASQKPVMVAKFGTIELNALVSHLCELIPMARRAWLEHGHSCFLCEIVIRSQFHTTYEPEA